MHKFWFSKLNINFSYDIYFMITGISYQQNVHNAYYSEATIIVSGNIHVYMLEIYLNKSLY